MNAGSITIKKEIPDWKIGFLGTFHPAEETFSRLAERGWVRFLIVPQDAGFRNERLLSLAELYGVPWSYQIRELETRDLDLLLAVNYPKIVPTEFLQRWPCINTHWSALPKYRGMHPTAWALINADYRVAVSVHWMEQDFDTGDILVQDYVSVPPDTTIYEMHETLTTRQADAVIRLLETHQNPRSWPSIPQTQKQATYVPRRVPSDGIINWEWSTERIWNLVRVLQKPLYPGAFTFHGSRKLIVWDARPVECPPYFATSGQIVRYLHDGAVWVKTGDTCLEVTNVQWGDESDSGPPADRFSGGEILGVRPQLVIPDLMQTIDRLEADVAALRADQAVVGPNQRSSDESF